jgi:hypothetical protein
MKFESRRGQNEKKNVLHFEKIHIFYYFLFTGPLALHLKNNL